MTISHVYGDIESKSVGCLQWRCCCIRGSTGFGLAAGLTSGDIALWRSFRAVSDTSIRIPCVVSGVDTTFSTWRGGSANVATVHDLGVESLGGIPIVLGGAEGLGYRSA